MNTVPWLRSGKGETPADGGCILQVIDWIHRNEWTDEPPCVHPVLCRLAIAVNDRANDDERQRLLDLAPRLMGTASDDSVLAVRLAVFCARWVLPIWEGKHPDDEWPRKAIEAAERWRDDPTRENAAHASDAASHAADAASHAAAYAAAAAHGHEIDDVLLGAVLDEFDRLTGRSGHGKVDWAPVCEVMAGAS